MRFPDGGGKAPAGGPKTGLVAHLLVMGGGQGPSAPFNKCPLAGASPPRVGNPHVPPRWKTSGTRPPSPAKAILIIPTRTVRARAVPVSPDFVQVRLSRPLEGRAPWAHPGAAVLSAMTEKLIAEGMMAPGRPVPLAACESPLRQRVGPAGRR